MVARDDTVVFGALRLDVEKQLRRPVHAPAQPALRAHCSPPRYPLTVGNTRRLARQGEQ